MKGAGEPARRRIVLSWASSGGQRREVSLGPRTNDGDRSLETSEAAEGSEAMG